MALENIDAAGDERGFGADGEGNGIERAIERAVRRGFCFFVQLGRRRILAFGEAVNAIVEKENFEADVAAEHVNGVIAADGEGIAVTGGDPNFEVGTNGFEAGGDGGRAAVNGVKAEGVHVIRKAGRAADAGDDDEIFALDAEFGEDGLDGGENGVVSAAGAPADFLVGLKVFFCEDGQACRGHLVLPNRPPHKAAATKSYEFQVQADSYVEILRASSRMRSG